MANHNIRVRFAPSPTGYLHVGGARTALYNYLYAKKMKGTFVYRVEDTDQARSTEESMRMQIQDMQWLKLDWDEGPEPDTLLSRGPLGPYRQSQRLDLYKKEVERLLESKKAYYCFCSDELLDQKKQQAMASGRPPHYDGTCRQLNLEESRARVAKGEKGAIRFRITEKDYTFQDQVRGEVSFPSGMVGDFIILRSDGMPVYNFCCVVDDALMKISHVLRAEEHLSNTLRQLMLYEGLGYPAPSFGHLSIILDTDRQKMSKRRGATSCHEFELEGYLPEALLNFVALLGWSSPKGQEILSMTEMIEQFSLDRLNSAPAVFDEAKLRYINASHLRALEPMELWKRVEPFLKEFDLPTSPDWRARALEVFKTSMETLKDAAPLFRPLSDALFKIEDEAQEVFAWESSRKVWAIWRDKLAAAKTEYLSEEDFNRIQDEIKNEAGVKGKFLFMPIRVAVIGKPHGAELKVLVPLMNVASLAKRVEQCLNKAQGQ